MSGARLECPNLQISSATRLREHQAAPYTTLPCVHCGLPTQCAADSDQGTVFCCSGCLGAYQLIHGWGLEEFYALRDQMSSTGTAQAAGRASRYEQFDTAEFLGPSTPVHFADGTCSARLAVHGLHCGACAWLIENAATREAGLHSARVRMCDHSLQLVFDPRQIKLSRIAQLLDSLGYGLAPLDPDRDNRIQLASRRLLIQIAIAGFLAANAMWIAVALYAGEFSGVAAQHRYFLGLVGTALGVWAVVGPGRTFFVGALASLRTHTPHMDLPVALGLTVGTTVGLYNAFVGRGHIYFDSLATLVFLLLLGRWIQFRQQQRAVRAVDLMLRITPRHANLVVASNGERAATEKTILVDTLRVGDVIRIAAGESVAADGQVLRGASSVDRSLLTGESVPVKIGVGDIVAAGTVNLSAPIELQVTATGRDSRIGRVLQSVEAATAEKTPMIQLADRIGGVFVIAITLLACITFAWWLPSSLSMATANATSLLIVACPCALALATPLAIAVGLARAAKSNILIRDGKILQQLARPSTLWFDKTGTLTEGRQRVSTLLGDEAGLRLAAAIEANFRHPVAYAIVREAEQRQIPLPSRAHAVRVAGGVTGTADRKRICVGNALLMREQGIAVDENLVAAMQQLAGRGESPILVACEGEIVTLLGLSDPIRPGATSLVRQLVERGWSLGILSGDHAEIVRQVAQRLGLPESRCHGGLAPEEKLAAIRDSQHANKTVVMVGDGANDAAALAAADVGIAIRGGAEISLQAAPVFIASGKLASIASLLDGSVRTTRIIYFNFALSLGYNLFAVGLAMSGRISPLVAALLMPISSISILALTLASRTFGEDPT